MFHYLVSSALLVILFDKSPGVNMGLCWARHVHNLVLAWVLTESDLVLLVNDITVEYFPQVTNALKNILVLFNILLFLDDVDLFDFSKVLFCDLKLVIDHVSDLSLVDLKFIVGEKDLHFVARVYEKVLLDVLHVTVVILLLKDLFLDMDAVSIPDLLENVN